MIKKYGMYVLVALLISIASIMIFIKLNPKELPKNLISATGKIDGNLINLNTKYSGRIQYIKVQDGEKITKNETIAIIKSDEYQEKLHALQERVKSAKHNLIAMQYKLLITKKIVPLNITKAQNSIKILKDKKAQLLQSIKRQTAIVKQNARDYKRVKTLYKKQLIAKQNLEHSYLKFTIDKETLQSLKVALKEADKSIEIAKNNYNAALIQKKKILAFQANIEAAKSSIKSLEANKDEIQVIINELTIKSPIDGFVIEKIANNGEVLGAGGIVATLIDPKDLYLKVFIDTMQNGKVKIGDNAVIFLDAYPNKAIKAKVVDIAANAEFTPKDVAVRSDRIQRVYALHLRPLKVDPLLKLGIAGIGIISIDGKDLPSSLNDIPVI